MSETTINHGFDRMSNILGNLNVSELINLGIPVAAIVLETKRNSELGRRQDILMLSVIAGAGLIPMFLSINDEKLFGQDANSSGKSLEPKASNFTIAELLSISVSGFATFLSFKRSVHPITRWLMAGLTVSLIIHFMGRK